MDKKRTFSLTPNWCYLDNWRARQGKILTVYQTGWLVFNLSKFQCFCGCYTSYFGRFRFTTENKAATTMWRKHCRIMLMCGKRAVLNRIIVAMSRKIASPFVIVNPIQKYRLNIAHSFLKTTKVKSSTLLDDFLNGCW